MCALAWYIRMEMRVSQLGRYAVPTALQVHAALRDSFVRVDSAQAKTFRLV